MKINVAINASKKMVKSFYKRLQINAAYPPNCCNGEDYTKILKQMVTQLKKRFKDGTKT